MIKAGQSGIHLIQHAQSGHDVAERLDELRLDVLGPDKVENDKDEAHDPDDVE